MDTLDRQRIRKNVDKLIDIIDFDKISPLLLEKKIFNAFMIDDINVENIKREKNKKLLIDLCTRGPTAFTKFLDVLRETDHERAYKILSESDGTSESYINQREENIELSETDGSKKIEPAQKEEKVKLATKWIENNECYKIYSEPRGLCLIINNYGFHDIKETRLGSERDAKMLKSVFTQLGYTVHLHQDKTASEMMEIFENFAKNPEHKKLHSCVIIIMSHGERGILYGTYCDKVYLDKVFKLFNNENCAALIEKPKLFFIQGCRGEKFGIGVPIPSFRDVHSDGTPIYHVEPQGLAQRQDKRIATWTDMLITYSTIEGYQSYRDWELGSWFMQNLIDVLMRRACDTSLMDMLNEVSRKVTEMESKHGEKQAVETISKGFQYKVYFNPGLKKPR